MTLMLELPDDIQSGLMAQAHQSGISPEAYAAQILREHIRVTHTPDLTRSQLAGQRIRELRRGVTLNGISVKELIEEGRE